jgi:hypothetical protein
MVFHQNPDDPDGVLAQPKHLAGELLKEHSKTQERRARQGSPRKHGEA